MPGPLSGKCASPLCGPGILMLGLASNDGLGGLVENAMVTAETATVYRGGGRRWLSAKAAAKAEAGRYYRLRHPCECEAADPSNGYPGEYCGWHDKHRYRFVRRVAKLLLETPNVRGNLETTA